MKSDRARLTIGFLAQESSGLSGFQDLVWKGIIEAAQKKDVNAVVIAGGMIDQNPENTFEKNRNLVYRLISKERLDGLVIEGTIGESLSELQFSAFCGNLSAMPMVSIFGKIPGYPSICVDNKTGLRAIMLHLIRDHHLSKIAFIEGWPDHVDAIERYSVYVDTLAECGIELDQDMVYQGDFTEASGKRAVEVLLSKGKKRIQAIVASNDDMAIGALAGLRALGMSVPEDVVVTGFDDTQRAALCFPPLTTVRQPFAKISEAAIDALIAIIGGGTGAASVSVPASPVLRQSCGCISPYVVQAGAAEGKPSIEDTDGQASAQVSIADRIIKESVDVILGQNRDAINRIVLSFIDDVQGARPKSLLEELKRIIDEAVREGRDVFPLVHALSLLKQYIPRLWRDERTVFIAGNRIGQAYVMIGEAAQRVQEIRRIESEKKANLLREVGQELITTFDFQELKEVIKSQLVRLGIPCCFISLFREMNKDDDGSEVFLFYDSRTCTDLQTLEREHVAHSLPPDRFFPSDRRFSYNIHPLYFKDCRFGYIIFELGPEDGTVYDTLQVQISSALMGAELLREREKTYRLLKKNQEQLLISEKMASLGRLTAGIAHEMNTPLAAARASIDVLEDLAEEYFKSIDNPRVLPEDHKAIVEDMRRCLSAAKVSIEKSASFIRGVKGHTSNLIERPREVFAAAPVVRDTLHMLDFVFKHSGCSLELSLDEAAALCGDPHELSQILANLANNAVEACAPGSGAVRISLERLQDGKVSLRVQDNGIGIPAENLSKIFDPMFTTKPFGKGTGLGLSIVHELAGKFDGQIEVESAPGYTSFTILFPADGKG